jgi:hypothetical protein
MTGPDQPDVASGEGRRGMRGRAGQGGRPSRAQGGAPQDKRDKQAREGSPGRAKGGRPARGEAKDMRPDRAEGGPPAEEKAGEGQRLGARADASPTNVKDLIDRARVDATSSNEKLQRHVWLFWNVVAGVLVLGVGLTLLASYVVHRVVNVPTHISVTIGIGGVVGSGAIAASRIYLGRRRMKKASEETNREDRGQDDQK